MPLLWINYQYQWKQSLFGPLAPTLQAGDVWFGKKYQVFTKAAELFL